MKRALVRLVTMSLICVSASSSLTGCDEVSVRDGATTQPLVFEAAAMRMLLAPEGIESMYAVARPEGFHLRHAARALPADDAELSIGPLDQLVEVTTRTADTGEGTLGLTTLLGGVDVALPLRYRRGVEVHICRFRVRSSRIAIDAELALVQRDAEEALEVLQTPQVEAEGLSVESLGGCEVDLDALLPDLETELIDYALEGFARSSSEALQTSPLEILGLIQRRVEMSRLSVFTSRRGLLVFDGRLSRDDAHVLSQRGLEASLDLASDARRADCAPPVELTSVESAGAAEVSASELRRYDAALGLALSMGSLQRIAQTATRAGFVCRGLEPHDETSERIASDDARLLDLGLDHVPVGPWVRTTLSPGTLPRIVTRPSRGDLQVIWERLSFEVYAEVLSVPTRILEIETDVRISLRPRAPSTGVLSFDVEALEVDRATIDSGWLYELPQRDALRRWTRRMLLLILADRLDFPLPIDPTSPLRVVGTDIRDDDLVVYLDFAR